MPQYSAVNTVYIFCTLKDSLYTTGWSVSPIENHSFVFVGCFELPMRYSDTNKPSIKLIWYESYAMFEMRKHLQIQLDNFSEHFMSAFFFAGHRWGFFIDLFIYLLESRYAITKVN